MTTAAPYRSGFCDSGRHDRCRGAYGTTSAPAVCDCPCGHGTRQPEPEVLGEIAAAPDLATAAAVERHCDTCTCGGTA